MAKIYETDEQFEQRLAQKRADYARAQRARSLALCKGCVTVIDTRKPCAKCAAFRKGIPCR